VSEREDAEVSHIQPHDVSLATWDLSSPIVAGRRATLKVGVTCSSGCNLAGTRLDVYSETGTSLGGATVGSALWPGTNALYWAELDAAAPDDEGDHSWTIKARGLQAPHAEATSVVRFVAVKPPEHLVTLEVIDKGSGAPLGGVELRIGPFRTATDDAGVARVEVPAGTYEVATWKIGYGMFTGTAQVSADTTIRVEVAVTPEAEQPYWM
jgi:hypothetical protein